jgi:hypothetical protein
MSREVRRGLLDDLRVLNEAKFAEVGDPEIVTRIAQYEMAYKMQASVPELTDFSTVVFHHSAEARPRQLWPGGHSAGIVRVQLPDGSAPGRARRPLRAMLPRRLGSSPQSDDAI